jgi:hypothetical protein
MAGEVYMSPYEVRGYGTTNEDLKSPTANVVIGVSKENSLIQKQNYATKLANIALQITQNNKERHK